MIWMYFGPNLARFWKEPWDATFGYILSCFGPGNKILEDFARVLGGYYSGAIATYIGAPQHLRTLGRGPWEPTNGPTACLPFVAQKAGI